MPDCEDVCVGLPCAQLDTLREENVQLKAYVQHLQDQVQVSWCTPMVCSFVDVLQYTSYTYMSSCTPIPG